MAQKVTCAKRVFKVAGAAMAPEPDQTRCVLDVTATATMLLTSSVFVPAFMTNVSYDTFV